MKETTEKAIDSLSTAEEHAKKLTDAIQEAIEAEQKKEDMKLECSLSKAKEQIKKLADKIEKAIEAGQENKDQALSKAKEQEEKLLKTIQEAINAQQKNEDQALKDSLYKAREQANLLVNTVSNAIGRLNKNEKELKGFLEKFNPLAVIMCANTLLYISKKIDKINENDIKCIEPSRLNYRARYNLACYYSILGDKKKDDQQTKAYKEAYKDALCHVECALEEEVAL